MTQALIYDPKRIESDAWIVTLGTTVTLGPRYGGSRLTAPSAMPSLSLRRPGEPEDFSPPEDGLDYTLYGSKAFQIGPVANIRGDRAAGTDARLTGLKKFPTTADAGMFMNVWPMPDVVRIRLELRQGLRADDGLLADLNGDLVGRVGAFTLSGGPRLSLGDAIANRLEFGISQLEAARNATVVPYTIHAGLRSVGYGAAVTYDWSPAWRTTLFHRFDRLVGEAGESPIVRRLGSPDQVTVGLGVFYSFSTDSLGRLASFAR